MLSLLLVCVCVFRYSSSLSLLSLLMLLPPSLLLLLLQQQATVVCLCFLFHSLTHSLTRTLAHMLLPATLTVTVSVSGLLPLQRERLQCTQFLVCTCSSPELARSLTRSLIAFVWRREKPYHCLSLSPSRSLHSPLTLKLPSATTTALADTTLPSLCRPLGLASALPVVLDQQCLHQLMQTQCIPSRKTIGARHQQRSDDQQRTEPSHPTTATGPLSCVCKLTHM